MTPRKRVISYWRRRLGIVLMAMLFVFLGYTGVAVMQSTYSATNTETLRRAPPDVQLDSKEAQLEALAEEEEKEKRKEDLSMQDSRSPVATPLVVLVLSSMPRGGSTLLTELLSAVQDSVVLFEPLWPVEKKPECYEDEECVTNYMMDILSCDLKPPFENWLKSSMLFFHYFSPQARVCINKDQGKQACINEMNVRALCAAAPVLIVKVIRARLSWMHNILENSLVNLKVIHLIRDPRASLNSISRFGWDSRPDSRCGDLEHDMSSFDMLRQVFPSTVMQVQYEQLCLNPEKTTKDIFRFLVGNDTLPTTVHNFLAKHMLSGKKENGSMSTIKNSTQEVEAWRFKISGKYLEAIEKEPACLRSIKSMGHALFHTEEAARNPALPLILNRT